MGKKIVTSAIPDAKEPGVAKTLQPGNVTIKINGISIKKLPYEGDEVDIILHCEGEPVGGDFEGFEIDRNKPELGRALGQVGDIRAQQYPFKDGATPGGKQLNREKDMLAWLMNFHKAIGQVEWLKIQGDFDTVDELVAHIDTQKPFKDIWMNSCIGGKGYINNKGYLNYDLYLTWFNTTSVPLEVAGTPVSKLTKFNKDMHIKQPKEKAKSVESFPKKSGSVDLDL